MKSAICLVICLMILVCLCACVGNIRNVETPEIESEMYSQNDIRQAIEIIKGEFRRDWKGCKLTEIFYAGDETTATFQDWADRNNDDEVIVLLSSFDVDSSGGDGSLNPNSTYKNWKWILVRTDGGQWKHVDHGY